MTMTRRSRTSTPIARLLRPSPARFAAAAAVHDPSMLMALQAAQADTGRRDDPPARRDRRGGRGAAAAAIRGPLAGERGAAGLEAKRERDLGELRDGRRLTVPVAAGLVAMAGSVAVYFAVTAGTPADHGLGMVVSTGTALAPLASALLALAVDALSPLRRRSGDAAATAAVRRAGAALTSPCTAR